MDFLKKYRKKKLLTAKQLENISGIIVPGIYAIENDTEILGGIRAKKLGEALGIPEDVMTVYRGCLPSYAKKAYRETPDKLERGIKKIVNKLEKEKV